MEQITSEHLFLQPRSTSHCVNCGVWIDKQHDSYSLVDDRSTEPWTWYVRHMKDDHGNCVRLENARPTRK